VIADYSHQCLTEFLESPKRTIVVIDYWDATPHLQTSLEICIRLALAGKTVYYYHWGSQVSLNECYSGPFPARRGLNIANDYLKRTGYKIITHSIADDQISAHVDSWPAFSHTEELRQFVWNGQPAGISVVSTLCDLFKASELDCRNSNCISLTRNGLSTFKRAYELTSHMINTVKPDAIVLFNGRYPSYSGSRYAAISGGIPTFFHERGSDNSRFLFTYQMPHSVHQNNLRLAHAAKQMLGSSGLQAFDHGLSWFYRRTSVSSQDLHYIRHFLAQASLQPSSNLRIYSFFVSSNDEIGSLPADVYPAMFWSSQIAALSDISSALLIYDPDALLVVRLHPNLVNKQPVELEHYASIGSMQNVILVQPNDTSINSYALAKSSHVVFVYCSTIGIEASQMGKKVYTMAPTYYDFLNVTTPIRTYAELSEAIQFCAANNAPPDIDLDLSHQFRCSIYGLLQQESGIPYKYYSPLGSNDGLFLGQHSLR